MRRTLLSLLAVLAVLGLPAELLADWGDSGGGAGGAGVTTYATLAEGLASCTGSNDGTLFAALDGADATDCATGAGASEVVCQCTGSGTATDVRASGGGGLPAGGSIGNVIVNTAPGAGAWNAQSTLASGTAAALAANGGNCTTAGEWPAGVDASGVVEGCGSALPANATPTIDGQIAWDSTSETVKVGDDGVATLELFPGAHTTVGADHIDAISEIDAAIKRGPDATDTHLLTTDVAAPGSLTCLEMDTDGSVVLAGGACGVAGGEANTLASPDLGAEIDLINSVPKTGTALNLVSLEADDFDSTTNIITIDDANWATQTEVDAMLPLAGGTLTGLVVADDLGFEFQNSAQTDCTGFTTGFGLFYSNTDNVFKKCEEGSISDLDTGAGLSADSVDFTHIDQDETLAGNPALLVDECYFAKTASGGGFICEGSAADLQEQLYLFPNLNGNDTTALILTSATSGFTTANLISGLSDNGAGGTFLEGDGTWTDVVEQSEIGSAVQAWDAELDTVAALTETNGAVMFVAGGAWTADLTPAIDCTDCTSIPAGTLATLGGGAAGANDYDFSGASVLTMKTAAGYTAAAEGDFGLDTTADELVFHDGAGERVVLDDNDLNSTVQAWDAELDLLAGATITVTATSIVVAPNATSGQSTFICEETTTGDGGCWGYAVPDGEVVAGDNDTLDLVSTNCTGELCFPAEMLEFAQSGATTEMLVGGGAGSDPVWTTATGSGAPVRATSPTLTTPVIGVATGTSLALTGALTGDVNLTTVAGTTHSPTGADMRGAWHFYTSTSAVTVTLPAVSGTDGESACFYDSDGTAALTIDANGTEVIVFQGTALSAGEAVVSTAAAGAFLCVLSNGTNFYTLGENGTWTEETP